MSIYNPLINSILIYLCFCLFLQHEFAKKSPWQVDAAGEKVAWTVSKERVGEVGGV